MTLLETRPLLAQATGGEEAWTTLFNRASYHALNTAPGQRRLAFDAVDDDGAPIGRLAGVVLDGTFDSGFSAPFGGPDLARPEPRATEVVALVKQAMAGLMADPGIYRARIRCRPASHGAGAAALLHALLHAGFGIEASELNYSIDLTRLDGPEAHLGALKPKPRNEIRRARSEPFTCNTAVTDREWETGYRLIAENHVSKSRPMRLSLAYLRRAEAAFPGLVRMDVLGYDGHPCASALSYRVRPTIELLVSWGDADHALPRSPMPLLAHRLLERAIEEGCTTWDLGIASENGVLNAGLSFFKERIGATAEPRLTLVKDFRP